MLQSVECEAVEERIDDYLNRTMSAPVRSDFEAHLAQCDACREAVQCARAIRGVIEYTQIDTSTQEFAIPPAAPSLMERFGAAPWWVVSAVLHVLVIALAGLISMAIELPRTEESVVMVTELVARKDLNLEPDKPKDLPQNNALATKHDVPPTDPTSKDSMDVVVPPDILKKAEIGDHFETINPDRPDTQSAFGNPDAHMFHDIRGNDEPPGGGGVGGTGLEDLIGVGGLASPGTGGGWGGGNGTGSGNGDGSGHGSFGNRLGGGRKLMVRRFGGTAKTENAVDKALQWLAYHQEPDGHWDSQKHGVDAKTHQSDIGCTGLALLAFLGAGHTEKVGQYKDNVRRAVKWFIDNQQPTGQYSCPTDRGSSRLYGHGIATMAMSEATGMAHIAETRASAQKAVDFVDDTQNRIGDDDYKREGWDYSRRGGTSDTSVTSWMILGLKSAKIAGLNVNHSCFEGGMRWLDAAQGPDGYKLGIWYRGRIAEVGPLQAANPTINNCNDWAAGPHSLLAASALMRMYMGTKKDEPIIANTGEYLLKRLPQWKPGNKTSFYHLYYGSLTMFQIGGDGWKQWNEALIQTLVPNQCKDGDNEGSWDPEAEVFAKWGGRVYTTAMGALCMEVYYRYVQINGK